ncbi:hypothetical protein ACKI1H_27260 [Pseudomonas sp. YH-1]|uniref:hypothetical protein n=1 Tax=Pseudomonas sp. YH-1 TaxID=3384787 RepID=UPI003F7E3919
MQIERSGVVMFSDASLTIREDREHMGWNEQKAWERDFKRQVFARIVQTLNRLGYTVGPNTHIFTDNNNRYARKGDLRADLKLCGRSITLDFFQNVSAPDRPDHAGRYQSDKEAHMPYLVRLEMERTRRRIRAYLCNVFTGYVFDDCWRDGRSEKRGPTGKTAMEFVEGCWRTSHHFNGDWPAWRDSYSKPGLISCFNANRRTADGKLLDQGQRVYFAGRKGRMQTGIAFYNINNMWWVVSGRYGVTNEASFSLYADNPGDLRCKRNDGIRRKRLEAELARATKQMDFRRAEVLRDILWPRNEPIYLLWHKGHNAYHRAGFSGYSTNPIDAGRFTREELTGWVKNGAMEDDLGRIVPASEAA